MTTHPEGVNPNRFRALAFDFDGTIVDSIDYVGRGWEEIAKSMGIELTIDVRDLVGMTGEQMADVISAGNDKLKETILQKRLSIFDPKRFVTNVKLFPEVIEVLINLRQRRYRTALASSTVAFKLNELSESYRIDGFFDAIIGGDEVPRSKPAPDLLFETAKRLSVQANDLAYVGDTAYDVEATLAAGSVAILVHRYKKQYGGPQPHFVISDLTELLSLV